MSSVIQSESDQKTWQLNFSQSISIDLILDKLQSSGIVLVRDTGEADPKWPGIRENQLVNAFINNGFSDLSASAATMASECTLTLTRPRDWKQRADESKINTFSCYFLGGDMDQRWRVGYDFTLKGEESSDIALMEAMGGDIILYSNWLRVSNPSPIGKKGNVIRISFKKS